MSDEADPAVLCAERQLRQLAEMAKFGMGLIRDLKAGEADTPEAFVRLSRAVRLTFALETKTHQDLRLLKGENAHVREVDEARTAEEARVAKETAARRNKSEIKRLVLAVAESESESLQDYNATWDRLEELADHDVRFRNLGDWQTRGAVERLCDDLGLNPDWRRWTDDGWDERYARPRWRHAPNPRPANGAASSINGAHVAPGWPPQLE